MVLLRGPLTLPCCLRRREPNVKNKLKKERGEVVRAREEGRGEGEVKQGHGHSLAVHFNYRTLPYPCISEMLIKGCFPEELSARLGPAHSTRLSWLLCKEAIASPQGTVLSLAQVLSAALCLSLLRRQCCCHTLGEEAPALLGNQPPRLWIKLRCRGS